MVAKTKRRVLEKQNAPYLLGQGPVYQAGGSDSSDKDLYRIRTNVCFSVDKRDGM